MHSQRLGGGSFDKHICYTGKDMFNSYLNLWPLHISCKIYDTLI